MECAHLTAAAFCVQRTHGQGPHLHVHGTHAAAQADEEPHGLFVFGRPF